MTNMEIARTILEQIGGNRFAAMTGARQFAAGEGYLTFRLPGRGFCKNGINFVKITLDASDTYTMEFIRTHGLKVTLIAKHEMLYAEDLAKIFRAETGLATNL